MCLFFKIDKAERVILEYGRETRGVAWEGVELCNPGRAETEKPHL